MMRAEEIRAQRERETCVIDREAEVSLRKAKLHDGVTLMTSLESYGRNTNKRSEQTNPSLKKATGFRREKRKGSITCWTNELCIERSPTHVGKAEVARLKGTSAARGYLPPGLS
jgi:hypothetical protein